MAVAQGYGKTVTSGSVFAYDTGDTRNSYRGEPTVNLVPTQTISSWSDLVNVSSTGDSITPPINGLIVNRVSRTSTSSTYFYSGNTWATTRASFGYFKAGTITQVTILGNSYNAGTYATFDLLAGTITAYQTVTPFIENVGEGWYRCGFSVTNGPSYPFLITLNGYTNETVTSGQYLYICGTQCEAKNHATPFVNGTRSATQGLLPLIGNTSLDLSTVSFDSNAQMTFDGTDDRIQTSYAPTFGDFTVCLIFKDNGSGAWGRIVDKLYTTGFFISSYFASSGANYVGAGVIEPNYPHGIALPYEAGKYHYFASVRNGTTHTIYLDGITQTTSKTVSSNLLDSTSIAFGDWSGSNTQPFKGELPIVRIYNRALSAAEVKQNYLHYKTRFNLS